MRSISEIAKMKLYPLGEYEENTRFVLITYLKELIGKALFIDNTVDYPSILEEWLKVDCIPLLSTVDLDIQYMNTMQILIQTLYEVNTDIETIKELLQPGVVEIPLSLRCNDYLPVSKLIERLRKIK